MNNFLVKRKVYCPICKRVLKRGEKIKRAEYHEECFNLVNPPHKTAGKEENNG